MSWTRFFRRNHWDRERSRELESYLEIETDENIARGMDPASARAAARRKLGNATIVREDIFRMNTIGWLDTIARDLRHGLRLLRRSPGFAAAAIASLALGIGANTAIFQLVDAVGFRPLPVSHPEQLAEIKIADTDARYRSGSFTGSHQTMTFPIWQAIRERQDAFSEVASWGSSLFDLASSGEMRFAQGLYVSGNFFSMLGVAPAVGRTFTLADDVPGCRAAGAVLSYAFWQREYAGDPAVVGRTIQLEATSFEIVGVSARRFTGVEVGRTFDVAVPICSEALLDDPSIGGTGPTHWFLAAIGRMKPRRTIAQASEQLAAISPGIFADTASPTLLPDIAAAYRDRKLEAVPAGTGVASGVRNSYSTALWLLLATSALILLIACANIANLLLARATARAREMAIRLAIGASRGRLIAQLLAESVLLAALGVAIGAALARVVSGTLLRLIQTSSDAVFATDLDLRYDSHLWMFMILTGAATCVIFGVAPALSATRTSPGAAMKSGGRGATAARSRVDARIALVVSQVALGLILLVGGVLFVRTFQNLVRANTGFDESNVWDLTIDPQHANVPASQAQAFTATVVARIQAIPGVEAAAAAHVMPLTGSFSMGRVLLDGAALPQAVYFNQVGPQFFSALHTPILAGRVFSDADAPSAAPVAIVNESFVRTYMGGRNPIGHHIQRQSALGQTLTLFEVVGLVSDTKYSDIREDFRPIVFLPYAQFRAYPTFEVAARTAMSASSFIPALTRAVAAVNPAVLVRSRTFESELSDGLVRERLMAMLSGFFAVLAMLLATFGLYGVMSFVVARRTTEIGVRMALGASARDVLAMILGEAAWMLGAGVVIGLFASAVASRAASSLLFGIAPVDPASFGIAAGVLVAAGLLASYVPAARASRLEPTTALRHE